MVCPNSTPNTDYVCFFSVPALARIGTDSAKDWSPVKGVLPKD